MENKKEDRNFSVKKSHPKMPRGERAKQFMPFDALKGFREALREVEEQVESFGNDKNTGA